MKFIADDLTNLQHVSGTFDLLVDYGVLDDLTNNDRDLYVKNILPLTHAGSQFLIYAFEWTPRWWERRFGIHERMALLPGKVERRFSEYFTIEQIAARQNASGFPRGEAVYLMTRKKWA